MPRRDHSPLRRLSIALLAVLSLPGASTAALGTPPIEIRLKNDTVGITDDLTIRIPKGTPAWDDTHKKETLRLFFNNIKVAGLLPRFSNTDENAVTFHLTRTAENITAWNMLLSRPGRTDSAAWTASLGYDDLGPISTSPSLTFLLVREPQASYFWIAIAILAGISVWAGLYTGMLRDVNGYYSLGRAQMLFWFWLIVASYGYIWMLTADRNIHIPDTLLALMGISAATGLAAGLIDEDKQQHPTNTAVATAVAPEQPTDPPTPPVKGIVAAIRTLPGKIRAFADDLVCSGDAMDLHRFQIVVWTLVLGLVFIDSVYTDLSLPDFDKSLLALMGISSGTYIGFKFPEKAPSS